MGRSCVGTGSTAAISGVLPRAESIYSSGCKKLRGGNDEWRVRVGDYRVVYTINDTELLVEVTRIRHRSEVYER